jgi:hypothetical protein
MTTCAGVPHSLAAARQTCQVYNAYTSAYFDATVGRLRTPLDHRQASRAIIMIISGL